jgi:hypothetical protein
MYVGPRITDFGRIEVHTYALSGSAPEVDETTVTSTGGGGGVGGIGAIGLLGGAALLAGRGSNTEVAAGAVDEEEEKQAPK